MIVDPSAFTAEHAGRDFAMVDFYAADCGHCQQFAPVWDKASGSSSLPIPWESKECYGPGWSHGRDFDFCKEMNITRFPTVKLVQFDTHDHPTTSWDFNGSRTAQALEDFASERLHALSDVAQRTINPLLGLIFNLRSCPRQSLAAFL